MRTHLIIIGSLLFATDCSPAPGSGTEASSAGIRAAEKAGASKVSPAAVYETRDLAHAAQRESETAEPTAYSAIEQTCQADAKNDYRAMLGMTIAETRKHLSETRTALAACEQSCEWTAAQLDTEKQARMSTGAKLVRAMKRLAAIAAVKKETRGVAIPLSGGVRFVSGRYGLLNTAMTKLNQVADALKAQDAGKTMVVEGHTDSRGSDSTNQPLSFNRASAVRDYLVSRGVASERMAVVGMGSSRPITDNNTSENRANNRRVEIIVARELHTSNL